MLQFYPIYIILTLPLFSIICMYYVKEYVIPKYYSSVVPEN